MAALGAFCVGLLAGRAVVPACWAPAAGFMVFPALAVVVASAAPDLVATGCPAAAVAVLAASVALVVVHLDLTVCCGVTAELPCSSFRALPDPRAVSNL